jgi:flagellar motor switch protein FliN/FliY
MTLHVNGKTDVTQETDAEKSGDPVIARNQLDRIKVDIETFLGKAALAISDIEALRAGDVVTLDQSLNALAELRVNNIAIARGEIVAIGDRFGVRITEIS